MLKTVGKVVQTCRFIPIIFQGHEAKSGNPINISACYEAGIGITILYKN